LSATQFRRTAVVNRRVVDMGGAGENGGRLAARARQRASRPRASSWSGGDPEDRRARGEGGRGVSPWSGATRCRLLMRLLPFSGWLTKAPCPSRRAVTSA